MNKKNRYTLNQFLTSLKKDQLIKINSKNVPLFFGTIYEFIKLKDYEYKGIINTQVLLVKINSKNDNHFINITLNFIVDFDKYKIEISPPDN